MERSTNALAELAERMSLKISEYSGDQNFKDALENAESEEERKAAEFFREYEKAQRIVAELAKVEKPIEPSHIKAGGIVHLSEMLEADKNRAVEIVRNCRAIADEGAGDGK